MQILFPEFDRLIRNLSRMSGPPEGSQADRPELANVLFCARIGRPGAWATFTNGFEILSVRVETQVPLAGRLLYPRADLVAAHRTMVAKSAQEGDSVLLAEGRVVLRRTKPSRARDDLDLAVPDGLFANLRNLPEATGPRSSLSAAALGEVQRATDLWDNAGDCLWLDAHEGIFSHSRGLYRRSPCALAMPAPRIAFSDFLGVMGLDPEAPCECYLAAFPGMEKDGSPWVGFEQPDAIYFSMRFSDEELATFDPASREARVRLLTADPRPWLLVPRRPERRELIRVLTEMGGEGVLITTTAKGEAFATNGLAEPISLPMVQSEGEGAMACRASDLCRVLRQDFGCLGLPSQEDMPGIAFRRSSGEEHGVITAASRPRVSQD